MKLVSKKLMIFFLTRFAAFASLYFFSLSAGSLGGSSTTPPYYAFQPFNNVFYDRQFATGVVRMDNGFTVTVARLGVGHGHGSCVFMDTCLSVSGAIDLRNTNTIFLLADLTLDNSVTFSATGGNIYGYDRALILKGNLTLPSNSSFHIGGRIVIEGQGNTLTIGNNSQLFVDTNATLTLRNIIVRNINNNPGHPMIQCAALGSQLALDNTILWPKSNFYFNQGKLFIHNDVAFTGTLAFVYQSPVSSFITSGAKLYFDVGTTLDFRPSTTGTSLLLAKDLLFMSDATSQLYLNGCTLKSTYTGFRLTTGQLLLDNKVSMTSAAALGISSFYSNVISSPDYSNTINSVAWSPDGRYVACGGANTQTINVYQFTGTSFGSNVVSSPNYNGQINSVAWSPDGRYIACGGQTTNKINVYQFTGARLIQVAQSASYGGTIYSVAWSPDGRYVACGGDTIFKINVYQFTGASLIQVAQSASYGDIIFSVAWSPDGRYVACGGATTQTINVYQFTGTSFNSNVVSSPNYNGTIQSVAWSPDGRYVACGGATTRTINVYQFTGTSLVPVAQSASYGNTIYSVAWSSDGRYIACGGFIGKVNVYLFTGTSLTQVAQSAAYGNTIESIVWSPDSNYVACGGLIIQTVNVYQPHYTAITTPQAISNSIVFGNSALGSSYDLNVQMLAGTNVGVDGLVNYDNVS